MQYLTQRQVAKTLSKSIQTIIGWRKQGRFPNAIKNGTWAIPQSDIDNLYGASSVKEPVEAEGAEVKEEIRKLKEDTELLKAKRENRMAKDGFDTIAEFDKAREELEPARQELERQRGLISEARASLQKNEQFREALKSSRDNLKERQELLLADAESLKAFYAKLEAAGKIDDTLLSKLKLNDAFYKGTISIGDTLTDVPEDSEFDNGGGETEEEEEDEE